MCTAISYRTKDHYFGRTLDLEFSYEEQVAITPRNYLLSFRKMPALDTHYAIIGMAHIVGDYPLYYEAANEAGLAIAGLNFPGNAVYQPEMADPDKKDNVAPFELIPWILGQCKDLAGARRLLERLNMVELHFSEKLPLTPLHWMISDRTGSITAEPLKGGMKIYENPVGVLTNNPPFDFQMLHLSGYMGLTRETPGNHFSENLSLQPYSRGMGALGLPGDLSSASRFVRAAFVKLNSVSGQSEPESVSQFFHILGAVEQQRGCVKLGETEKGEGIYERTIYSSCCNTDRGIYYYTTYENRQITGIDMRKENLDGRELIACPLILEQQIWMEN